MSRRYTVEKYFSNNPVSTHFPCFSLRNDFFVFELLQKALALSDILMKSWLLPRLTDDRKPSEWHDIRQTMWQLPHRKGGRTTILSQTPITRRGLLTNEGTCLDRKKCIKIQYLGKVMSNQALKLGILCSSPSLACWIRHISYYLFSFSVFGMSNMMCVLCI